MNIDEAAKRIVDVVEEVRAAGFDVGCHWSERVFIGIPDTRTYRAVGPRGEGYIDGDPTWDVVERGDG